MEREHEALGYRERARANKAWGYTHTTQNEACAACGYKERGRERERKQQRERERQNETWGYRDIEAIEAAACTRGVSVS
jgi:ribosomal protein L37E